MGADNISSSQIIRTAAVLHVNSRTVIPMRNYFVNQLGFSVGTEVGNGPSFVTLDRDGQTIMLACNRSFGFRKSDWVAYFWVSDIDGLLAEFKVRGAKLKGPITVKDYGCRELIVIAPDGSEIAFGELQDT